MTVYNQKSATVTDLDATPIVRHTAGEGAAGLVRVVDGWITPTASGAQYSTYQLARIPSNATLKAIELASSTQGTGGALDIGIVNGGTTAAAIGATDAGAGVLAVACFGDFTFDPDAQSAWVRALPGYTMSILGTAAAITANATWTAQLANSPIWKQAGLSTDTSNGYVDVTLFATDEALGASAADIYFRIEYVYGGN